jgi:hypothetical protein
LKQLKDIIEQNCGVATIYGDKGIDTWDDITHIISNTSDFRQYAESLDLLLPVVTTNWITICITAGKSKLAPLRPYTPDPNMFFSNLTLTCADIPQGDKDAIIGAVVAMGGVDSNSLTKATTHICALTLDHPKCEQALQKGLKVKIVLPHW